MPEIALDSKAAAQRLGAALAFPTVTSVDRGRMDDTAFRGFCRHLENSFPLAHGTLLRQTIGAHYALLYTWRGGDVQAEPWLLSSHQDVAPIEQGTEADWTYPPFSGAVAEGHIWGRGAIDLKLTITAALEAAEYLLARSFQPRRTIYFAFGADEEVGGQFGAAKIAERLRKRGVRLAFTLDEGGMILSDAVPGIDKPVALIGTAEKGYLTLRLTGYGPGGHSSMPPQTTAVGRIARAITAIERHRMPSALDEPMREMFALLAPEAVFPYGMIYANVPLTSPLLLRMLEKDPITGALVRTTSAATLVEGGVADNVVPQKAAAIVNFRLKPGDRLERVLRRVRRFVADSGVQVEVLEWRETSRNSSTQSPGFKALATAVQQVVPEAVVAPCLTVNSTDSRYYESIVRNQYRFVPVRSSLEDLKRIHGTDERISVKNYEEIVQFFIRFIHSADCV